MLPGSVTIKRLLYISDIASNGVFVYDYDTGEQVGQLAGFSYPQGQCVDALGDVWIANNANGGPSVSVVEYAHGGTAPIATLIPDGHPSGCSIDPRTGSLAVANFTAIGNTYGDIEVWRNPSSPPARYVNAYCGLLTAPGFDRQGNLFVEGYLDGHPPNKVCELPAGGHELIPLTLDNGSIHDAAGVMWDGKFITFSDTNPFNQSNSGVTAIYQTVQEPSVGGKLGPLKIVGQTILTDTCFNGQDVAIVPQPFIVGNKNTPKNDRQGRTVVGGNIVCYYRFGFWAYPAGGLPTVPLQSPPRRPEGQSVSIVP